MHGLVSLLPEPYYTQVSALWDELEERFGLRGIRVTPYPHFSWQIGEEYPSPALEETMRSVAKAAAPLEVRTSGLGLFTGPNPVLFIPVVKSPPLVALHARIWNHFAPVVQGASNYYSPDNWMPHISLAYTDLDHANIGPVIAALATRSYTWEMPVDNLAFIYEPAGTTGHLRYKVDFQRAS